MGNMVSSLKRNVTPPTHSLRELLLAEKQEEVKLDKNIYNFISFCILINISRFNTYISLCAIYIYSHPALNVFGFEIK